MELHPDTFCGHGRTMWSSRDEQVADTARSLLLYASLRYSSTADLAYMASVPVLFLTNVAISSVPVLRATGIGVPADRYMQQASRRAEVAAT